MELSVDALQRGLHAARASLEAVAESVARAGASGSPRVDAAMGDLAGGALFTEALLAAVRARLAEIRTVAK